MKSMRSKGNRRANRALAEAVRARRKRLGVSQVELARLARVGPVFIYDVESAKPTVRLDKLVDVLEVLGLELVLREGTARLRVERTS
jgi:y4mF family transcriptional regulator